MILSGVLVLYAVLSLSSMELLGFGSTCLVLVLIVISWDGSKWNNKLVRNLNDRFEQSGFGWATCLWIWVDFIRQGVSSDLVIYMT